MTSITIEKSVRTAVRISPRVLETAGMFGLGVDETRELAIVPRCEIPLPHLSGRSGIVYVTGPSGSGKSTILKLILEQARKGDIGEAIAFEDLPADEDLPLVDVFGTRGLTLEETMPVLAVTGLSDAFVMLRRPCELSDGQRYRLRLALTMARVMHGDLTDDRGALVIADEFCSTLDRPTAMTISRNVRRWIDRRCVRRVTFIAATAHDDVLEALAPEVLVWKGLGETVEVATR